MENTYLVHHGIKGQRWGVRRFQNEDGTLTKAGEKRYRKQQEKELKDFNKRYNKGYLDSYNKATYKMNKKLDEINSSENERKYMNEKGVIDYATKQGHQYVVDVSNAWKEIYTKQLYEDYGEGPSLLGKDWVEHAFLMNMYDEFLEEYKDE